MTRQFTGKCHLTRLYTQSEIHVLKKIGNGHANFNDHKEIMAKILAKMNPRDGDVLKWVENPGNGCVTSDPAEISEITKQHWTKVFDGSQVNPGDMRAFFEGCDRLPEDFSWEVSIKDVGDAIDTTGDSCPGPDSIIFACFRKTSDQNFVLNNSASFGF